MDRSTSIFPKSKISLKKLKNYDMKIIKKMQDIRFNSEKTVLNSSLAYRHYRRL